MSFTQSIQPLETELHYDETQALCEDQKRPQVDEILLPAAEATPNEVQDFITQLLKNKRGLPVEAARRIALQWTLGTGRELRTYTPSMYFDIFGQEAGWTLYRAIRLALPKDQTVFADHCKCSNHNITMLGNKWAKSIIDVLLICVAFLEGAVLALILKVESEEIKVMAVMISIVGAALLIGLTLMLYTNYNEASDKTIETKLQACSGTKCQCRN